MKLESYSFSGIGGREENQDSIALDTHDAAGMFVVADGLGGHQHGQMASRCAADTLLSKWQENDDPDGEALAGWIGTANQAILKIQTDNACVTKSTVVALAIHGGKAVWAHSGDSRLYYIHNDQITSVTEDHSVAYMKYKAGEITKESIATDEDQSSLLRTLGNETRWEPTVNGTDSLTLGDAFLLCSDGLWEYVLDEEVLIDRLKAESAMEWGSLLLLRAAQRVRPGNDNISLITVMLK